MKKAFYLCLVLFFQTLFLSAQSPTVCNSPNASAADDCSAACISCQLQGYSGQTTGYTPGTAPGFCSTVHNDQWLAFIAGADNIEITVSPSNCQQGDGLETALYSDCTASPIACTPGQPGNGDQPSTVSATLVPGQTYFLMINSYEGDACSFTIATSPANAVQVPAVGPIGVVQGPAVVAEKSSLLFSVDSSAYTTNYRWTGPSSWKINGQTPPVDLAAPAGRQVNVSFGNEGGLLSVQASNACSQGTVSSQRIFIGKTPPAPPCPANPTPAADICAYACVQCNFSGYSGSTSGYSADSVSGFCGIVDNNQWIGFVAGATAATFTLTASNCADGNGLQMALYQNCTDPPLACAGGNLGAAGTPLLLNASLQPGQNYFLMVDGYQGDECDFTLTANPLMAAQAPPLGSIGPISGPSQLCPGASVTYSVPPVSGAAGHSWQAPMGWLINGQAGPYTGIGAGSNNVTITAGANGGQISVWAFNSCVAGDPVVKNISVQPIPPTTFPPVQICNEDIPYQLPWGDLCYSSGLYLTTLSSSLGCDSVLRQQVIVKPPLITFLPPKAVCAGTGVEICGEFFFNGGSYSKVCASYLGCDSLVNFSVLVLEPVAQIMPSQDPLCATSPLTLNSIPSPGAKTWKLITGEEVGTGNSLTVTQSGVYILEVTATAGGNFCIVTDSILIDFNSPPTASALGGTLTCSQPSVQLQGSSNTPGALFAWTGPGNFVSNEKEPIVDAPGIYVLLVTGPQTGCTATASAAVLEDAIFPLFPMLDDLSFNCIIPFVELPCPSFPFSFNCSWSGPGLVISPGGKFLAVDSGFYQLVVTAPNGCTATDEIWVQADTQAPVITAYADTLTCLNPVTMLHCTVDIPNVPCVWTFTGNSYLLTATAVNGCSSTATVEVPVDISAPTVTTQVDTLRCDQPFVTLNCTTNVPGALFMWSGPGGVVSMLQNPIVTQPGIYEVTVTDPGNGCTAFADATVLADANVPLLILAQVSNDLNGQGLGAIDISVVYSGSFELNWYLNGSFFSDSEDLSGLMAGIYEAVVTGSNGCSSSLQVTVLDSLVSTFAVSTDQLWEIFPNPANSVLQVRYRGNDQPEVQFWLFNAAGQLVLEQAGSNPSDWTISCEHLPPGVYTALIQTQDGLARKLVAVLR